MRSDSKKFEVLPSIINKAQARLDSMALAKSSYCADGPGEISRKEFDEKLDLVNARVFLDPTQVHAVAFFKYCLRQAPQQNYGSTHNNDLELSASISSSSGSSIHDQLYADPKSVKDLFAKYAFLYLVLQDQIKNPGQGLSLSSSASARAPLQAAPASERLTQLLLKNNRAQVPSAQDAILFGELKGAFDGFPAYKEVTGVVDKSDAAQIAKSFSGRINSLTAILNVIHATVVNDLDPAKDKKSETLFDHVIGMALKNGKKSNTYMRDYTLRWNPIWHGAVLGFNFKDKVSPALYAELQQSRQELSQLIGGVSLAEVKDDVSAGGSDENKALPKGRSATGIVGLMLTMIENEQGLRKKDEKYNVSIRRSEYLDHMLALHTVITRLASPKVQSDYRAAAAKITLETEGSTIVPSGSLVLEKLDTTVEKSYQPTALAAIYLPTQGESWATERGPATPGIATTPMRVPRTHGAVSQTASTLYNVAPVPVSSSASSSSVSSSSSSSSSASSSAST